MCLDHTIAHETYHFFPTLPLEPVPTCSPNHVGHYFHKLYSRNHPHSDHAMYLLPIELKVVLRCKCDEEFMPFEFDLET